MPHFSDDLSDTTFKELRVAGGTRPKELAASIIHALNDNKRVRLAAIGHQAVGQAVKAIPVVNQYCIAQGYLVAILPGFALKDVPNRELDEAEQDRLHERTIILMTLVRVSPQ